MGHGMQVHQNAEKKALEDRRALLGSGEAQQRQVKLETEADVVGAAANVTGSLQRTYNMLAEVCTRLLPCNSPLCSACVGLRACASMHCGPFYSIHFLYLKNPCQKLSDSFETFQVFLETSTERRFCLLWVSPVLLVGRDMAAHALHFPKTIRGQNS
jgi:hypothetical protein